MATREKRKRWCGVVGTELGIENRHLHERDIPPSIFRQELVLVRVASTRSPSELIFGAPNAVSEAEPSEPLFLAHFGV